MAEHKFKITLMIDNIGPHYADNSINFSIDVNSNKAVFYAANGTGKTFISRSFRAIEINSSNLDDVLTLGKESGEFFLSVDNKSVSLQIHRGDKPVIADSLNRLFHVFNHDFVEENIIPRHYSPNGEIEGYILGKEQIDLTNERNRERELKDCIENLNTQLDDRITEARRKLSTAGVTSNTTEMKLITTDAFKNGMAYTDIATYDHILSQLDLLSKIPDDMRDITVPSWNNIESQFDELGELLNTSFPDNNQDQEFVKFMRDNNSFIKDGLSIYETDPQACPFCKRSVDNEVLNIIQKYKKFCADQASKTISKLKKYSSDLDALCNRINNYNIEIAKATMALEQFKKYLPSLKDYSLSRIDTDGLVQELIDKIKYSISTKIDDLSLSISESHEFMALLSNFIKTATKIYEINRDLIVAANRTKNNTNADRLALRRNLCKAIYNQSRPEVSQILSRINEKQNELKSLQSDISEKENKIKISKREKVYNTLICLLDMFFLVNIPWIKIHSKYNFKEIMLAKTHQKYLVRAKKV